MKFQKIRSKTLSEIVAEGIEQNILDGKLLAGNKLPAERALAAQFDVSRPSVREAINKLQAKGLVRKVPGGGNYIADNTGASFSDPLLELISSNENAPFHILEMRFAIEGLSAYFAAIRATRTQKENIRQKWEILNEAHSTKIKDLEAKADVEFHLAIAEASNNPVIVHLMRNLLNILQISIYSYFEEAGKGRRKHLPAEHEEIMQHIINSDSVAAQKAMQAHIAGIEHRLANTRFELNQDPNELYRSENLKKLV